MRRLALFPLRHQTPPPEEWVGRHPHPRDAWPSVRVAIALTLHVGWTGMRHAPAVLHRELSRLRPAPDRADTVREGPRPWLIALAVPVTLIPPGRLLMAMLWLAAAVAWYAGRAHEYWRDALLARPAVDRMTLARHAWGRSAIIETLVRASSHYRDMTPAIAAHPDLSRRQLRLLLHRARDLSMRVVAASHPNMRWTDVTYYAPPKTSSVGAIWLATHPGTSPERLLYIACCCDVAFYGPELSAMIGDGLGASLAGRVARGELAVPDLIPFLMLDHAGIRAGALVAIGAQHHEASATAA